MKDWGERTSSGRYVVRDGGDNGGRRSERGGALKNCEDFPTAQMHARQSHMIKGPVAEYVHRTVRIPQRNSQRGRKRVSEKEKSPKFNTGGRKEIPSLLTYVASLAGTMTVRN